MANISAVIVPAKVLVDGRHKIRISVSHNSKTRYIVTDITIDSSKEFKDGMIVKRPDAAIKNVKLRGLLDKYQKALDDIGFSDSLSCEELIEQIKNHDKFTHRTLESIYMEYLSIKDLKPSTLTLYKSLYRSAENYIGGSTLIEQITHATVLGYDKFNRDNGNSNATMAQKQVFVMTLYYFAQKCHYIPFKADPWFGYTFPEPVIRDSWVTLDDIVKIRDLIGLKKTTALVRDLFMLSFYLGGMNIVDITKIDFSSRHIKYERSKMETRGFKVNKYVEFDMPDEAAAIVDRISSGGYVVPAKYRNKDSVFFQQIINYHIKKIADAIGAKSLLFYSARKTWSQIAFEHGEPTNVIDFILGHKLNKNGTSLYHYIEVTSAQATQTLKNICMLLK